MNRLSRLAALMEDPTLPSRIKLLFQLRALLLSALLGAAAADKGPSPSQSYGAAQDSYRPQVKYGGPIVYSGEKPPIIHFPPPPEVKSCSIVVQPTLDLTFFSRLIPTEVTEENTLRPPQ